MTKPWDLRGRDRSKLLASVAVTAFLPASLKAQAGRDLVSVSDIDGVASSRVLENGALELTLENGRIVTIPAENVVVQNGGVFVSEDALAAAGLASDGALPSGLTAGLIGLGAVGVGAATMGGGSDVPSAPPLRLQIMRR